MQPDLFLEQVAKGSRKGDHMGRNITIDDHIAPQRGRPLSWSGNIAKQMKVDESVLFGDEQSAYKLRESIRHYHGKGAASVRKLPFCGWRVWRTE